MENKIYEDIIVAAFLRLRNAVRDMQEQTSPHTPLPRPKVFSLGGFAWPHIYSDGVIWERTSNYKDKKTKEEFKYVRFYRDYEIPEEVRDLCEVLGYKPNKMLRCLRQIQAATAWCNARAEGRRRAAEEILRQQSAAVEGFEAEAAMMALEK